jgi:ABC-type antimicrobial peptide transport system permease subunit
MIAILSAAFGALAALLAAIGLYGVMAYNMSRRTGEIGIRMALGAKPGDIGGLVLREALLLIGVGVLIGLPAAFAAGRFIRGMLYGLGESDPLVLTLATGMLAIVGIAAACIPAWRASRIEPSVALRCQ